MSNHEKNSLYHIMSAEESNVDSILFIFRMWGSRNWGSGKFFFFFSMNVG